MISAPEEEEHGVGSPGLGLLPEWQRAEWEVLPGSWGHGGGQRLRPPPRVSPLTTQCQQLLHLC